MHRCYLHQQMSVLLHAAYTRGGLLVVHGVSARSAARRRHKQWKQQRREQKAWQNETEQLAVQYQVVLPPPEHLLTSPPQFFEPEIVQDYQPDAGLAAGPWLQEPPAQQQQQQQQQPRQARRQQQQQRQAGVPGPVRGPSAPAGAIWVEHRRTAAEQQQYRLQRRRQQQARAKPQLQKTHDLQDLLATTEQIQQLQQEGLWGVAAAAAARASAGRQPVEQQQQQQQRGRRAATQRQQQQELQQQTEGQGDSSEAVHVPVLSTDLLWQQAHELRKAQQRH